jgi:hypothetical protein
MTMMNSSMVIARGSALGLLLALSSLACGCGTTHDGEPSSSGSHWLTCKLDRDCSLVTGSHCGGGGVCVDENGARVRDPNASTIAGSGANAGANGGAAGRAGSSGRGGSGAPGGAAGATAVMDGGVKAGAGGRGGYDGCAGKSCGETCTICAPGDVNCIETEEIKRCDSAGTCTGGSATCSADAGVGVTLPDCGSLGSSAGSVCSAVGSAPVPECCDASTHLRCEYDACTDSIPGMCRGTYQALVGSKLCGGYQPCAGKGCGDACTICEPGDPACSEPAGAKACDRSNACVAATPDCTPPPSCDPSDLGSCGAGQACCAVGRCGPIETGEGICETADAVTGGCVRCACEDQPGGCPICNSPDTPIATPDGERAIADLREGDLVLSMSEGRLVAVPVLATRSVQVFNHAVVRLVLDNGRSIEISGSHPTADGQRLDTLQPGDAVGDVHVQSIAFVPYEHERTYDILPASETGSYVAGGALIGSTLFHR